MTASLLPPPAGGLLNGDPTDCPRIRDAVLGALAAHGYEALTIDLIQHRAGTTAPSLDPAVELEDLITAALAHVRLFATPAPTGSLRGDLRLLLRPWEGDGRDARAIAAVLSAADRRPALQKAVVEALDRPLGQALGSILVRAATTGERISPHVLLTLNWILRSLAFDRLRASTPRCGVDLDQLIDLLLAAVDRTGPGHTCRHGDCRRSAPACPHTGTAGDLP
jgi:hypothetical protein